MDEIWLEESESWIENMKEYSHHNTKDLCTQSSWKFSKPAWLYLSHQHNSLSYNAIRYLNNHIYSWVVSGNTEPDF